MIAVEEYLRDALLDTTRLVVFRQQKIPLSDVPLGREYKDGGRVYQSCTRTTSFGALPFDHRFKYRGVWYTKVGKDGARHINTNTPFGVEHAGYKSFSLTETVEQLAVEDRGPVV